MDHLLEHWLTGGKEQEGNKKTWISSEWKKALGEIKSIVHNFLKQLMKVKKKKKNSGAQAWNLNLGNYQLLDHFLSMQAPYNTLKSFVGTPFGVTFTAALL